jgi:Ribonucleotide reductase, small chain/SCP-2 sterol transfer family
MTTTTPDTRSSPAAAAISYEDLYSRWEASNWSATQIDFTEDARQWREVFTDHERKAALWNYSLFFWGEDAVADNLSPYIDAAPLEEQKYFLTTQQVDEARHAVFFKRFMEEVVGLGDGSIGGTLQAIKPELTWGFRKVFDRLDTMADELRKDRSRPKLAAAITLYHVIIEAGLAQSGQHFITSYLAERDLLPGFREGMENVARDEQRHIAFGVKLLHDLNREDPRCRGAVADLLREVLPWTAAVLVPPGWDESYVTCFGFTFDQIGEEGSRSVETKLRSAGLPLEELPGSPPIPLDLSHVERTRRGRQLVQAGVLGEKNGPPAKDAEAQELLFDTIRRSVNPDHGLRRTMTFQWDFADADPWYVVVDNGSSRAERGRAPDPDVTLRTSWEDWVDMIGGRLDPRRAVLTRRLRPKGRLRDMLALPKVFGPR